MGDPREALVAQLRRAADRCCQCTDGHHDWVAPYGTDDDVRISRDDARKIADIMAAGWTPPTVKPSVEDVARALFDADYHDIDATERNVEWGVVNGTDHARKRGTAWHRQARAVLALFEKGEGRG